ncbi:MAG: hypothetical protein ACJAUD_001325 [Crocinitomicaceae bacterium]|jgi:hypothetical protein
MERELNSKEEQLYDLMESKSFGELSSDETHFVLSQTTMEEYIAGFTALGNAQSLNDGFTAKPLILNYKRVAVVIPLYQTIAAIAAAVLISFFVFRSNEVITKVVKVPSVAVADTVFIDNSRYDTVVEREIQFIDRVIYQKVHEQIAERKQIQSNSYMPVPEINSEDILSMGQSLKNDETFVLVQDLIVGNESGIFRRD